MVNWTLAARNVSAECHIQHSVEHPATEETRVLSGLAVVCSCCAPVSLGADPANNYRVGRSERAHHFRLHQAVVH